MIFGKGFEILYNFFFGLRRRNNIEYMLAP
jgi:hypothetical protein